MSRLISRYTILLVLLCFYMGAWADNVVTVSSSEGAPDEEVTVSIGLQNSDVLSSLQVSIPLDQNLTFVDGSGLLGSRCGSHSLTVGVKDGVLNVFVFSASMTAITGNSGEVASFKLKLGNQPATMTLQPSKLVLVTNSGAMVTGSAQSGNVTIRCAKAQYSTMEVDFGAVPILSTYNRTVTVTNVGNDALTITDLNFSDVNVFSSTTTLPLTIAAGASKSLTITYAPVERGSINRTLKVECNSISKLNTIKLKAQPFAVNELHVQNASGISDEEVTVSMTMNNMDAISGFQIEFTLPGQLEYVDGSFKLSDRKQDHVTQTSLTGNVLRIIAYSLSNKAFTDNDGEIGEFKVKLTGRNGLTLKPTKTVLTATNTLLGNVVSAVYGGQISISSPRINTANTLDFGAVSVTESCQKTFTIRNTGAAPLTVNRIVFSNENLSVEEDLPIVIAAGGSRNVTIAYSSLEQKTFEAKMQIYSNDPDLRLKEVTVTGSRFAPNFMDFRTPDIEPDENVSIEVSANIYEPIAAMQFDLEYPSAYYETFDNNYTLEQRAQGMTVQMMAVNDHTMRVFCYFLGGGNLAAGEGKIMTLLLRPKTEVNISEGTYQVSVKNIKLSTSQMTDKYAGTDIVSSFNVEAVLLGDANKDGNVTIGDIVSVVNIIAGNTGNYNLKAADANKDGTISVGDIVSIVNIMAGNN